MVNAVIPTVIVLCNVLFRVTVRFSALLKIYLLMSLHIYLLLSTPSTSYERTFSLHLLHIQNDRAVVLLLYFQSCKGLALLPRYPSSVWGPTCDGLDCLHSNCLLPELRTGDWLMYANMGAYTLSAATAFNGMPAPQRCYVIRREMM